MMNGKMQFKKILAENVFVLKGEISHSVRSTAGMEIIGQQIN